MRASERAFDKIIGYEVSSEAYYTKRLQRPEWPGHSSGATVGIGYDLGQTPAGTIRADWGDRVDNEMLGSMIYASGKTGAGGRIARNEIRDDVLIPWDTAIAVHKECVIPRWEARVLKALPGSEKLPADCFGALLSLAFNRGTSFTVPASRDRAGRYREMRAIRAVIIAGEYNKVPDLIRSMKRLWPTSRGLCNRRDDEARLFEDGLRSWKPEAAPKEPEIVARPDPINMGDDDDGIVIEETRSSTKPITRSKTVWGGVVQWITGAAGTIVAFVQGLPPWLIALAIVAGLIGLYLVIKGRIDVNEVVRKLSGEAEQEA